MASESKIVDSEFLIDGPKLRAIAQSKPWQSDAKWFKRVRISGSAAMKMLMHAQSGVEKGVATGGKPIEIMGLIVGRVDVEDSQALLVTDVFALPIEGTETRVLADDQAVIDFMIETASTLELTQQEVIMGWYHSHPFDLGHHPRWFLSATDVQTQLSWQRSEDPHGNPFLAIVIDPLRSIAKGRPELGAFRVYPPEFTSTPNECPDGAVVTDEVARIERWGSAWNRYHCLEISYYLSSLSSEYLSLLSKNYMWIRTLSASASLDKEARERTADRISDIATLASTASTADVHTHPRPSKEGSAASRMADSASALSIQETQSQALQIVKRILFGELPLPRSCNCGDAAPHEH